MRWPPSAEQSLPPNDKEADEQAQEHLPETPDNDNTQRP